jgi:hypothetical protein
MPKNGNCTTTANDGDQTPRGSIIETCGVVAAGVTAAEIRHALLMLLSTIGMPNVVAALSWADDVLVKR